MKIKKILILWVLSPLMFFSCTDEDLDTIMYGSREDSAYYQNMTEINEALTSCYYFMKQVWNDMTLQLMFINDCGTDDCDKGGSGFTDQIEISQFETGNIFSTNSRVSNHWSMSYRSIYEINKLLDKIDEYRESHPELSETDKTLLVRYENEARWIRGMWYFNLAYLWGDVPLFLHPENPSEIYKPRTPVDKVWEQVIADFKAATALPKRSEYSIDDLGRATSGAAYAMLGRTYWFIHDYNNAYEALKVLVEGDQKGEYELDPDFATQWLNHNSNVRESIFEIQYYSNGGNWELSSGWPAIWFLPVCDGGYAFHLPTPQLKEAFDPNDPRLVWTFIEQGDKFVGNDYATVQDAYPHRTFDRKHFVPACEHIHGGQGVTENDLDMTVYIIRYADVLLMYSEACLEKGDLANAREYLNQVRRRARQSSTLDPKREIQKFVPKVTASTLADITTDNVEELRKAIWNERRCEFACEGMRRLDLVQQGRLVDVMTEYYEKDVFKENPDKGRYFTDEKVLFPIPQTEIDYSQGALVQNSGY